MNGHRRILSLVLGALLCLPSLQLGCREKSRPKGGAISGTVVKSDGSPVRGAVVVLDGLGLSCTSDAKGRYSLGPLPADSYSVVATYPGLKTGARFSIEVAEGQRVAGVDFQLEADPNYVSDSVKIEQAKPAPGSVLRAGSSVRFEVVARCNVVNAAFAKVKFTAQDENDRPVIQYPSDHTLTPGERLVPFVRVIQVPNRVRGKLFIAAIMLPEGERQHPVIDFISYEVRRYEDGISLPRVELKGTDENDRCQVSLLADVSYRLDLLEEAALKLTAKVAYRDREAVDLLKEESRVVKKSVLASGTQVFAVPLMLPPDAGSVLVRVELVSQPSGDVVDYAIHKPVPVPWDLGDRLEIRGVEEKEQTK